tara:strand:+ start:2853 stop:3449 length:597 start_codon:yes stop_codon:yes gene_type:complete
MPERVTREERMVSLAIEKARLAKEELSAKKRMNIEPTQVLEIDTDPEVEKITRPKVQDASKITNQTQKKEGYGLAGESLKKQDKPKRMVSFKNTTKDVRSADSYLSPEKRKKKANRVAEMKDALERGQRKDKSTKYSKMESQIQQIRGMLDRMPKNNLERLLKDNLEDSGLNITSEELLTTLSVIEGILVDMNQGMYN